MNLIYAIEFLSKYPKIGKLALKVYVGDSKKQNSSKKISGEDRTGKPLGYRSDTLLSELTWQVLVGRHLA